MNKKTQRLVFSAIMVALATVLSFIKIIDMPYGGSVTMISMAPIIIVAYKYGVGSGLTAGLVYSIIQLILGAENLTYATWWGAAVAIALLDYIFAFGLLGLGGVFRKKIKDQSVSMVLGAVLVCFLRYICHTIAGCTVWAGVSIPSSDGLLYSLVYNAAYMVPETIATVIGVLYLSRILDFKSEAITRAPVRAQETPAQTTLFGVSLLLIVAAVIFDAIEIFASIQTEEGFAITNISTAPWITMAIVTLCAAVISAILLAIRANITKADAIRS